MRRFGWLLLAAAMLPVPAWALTASEIVEKNKDAVVFLQIAGTDASGVPKEATATGFVVSSTGHVITAKHIVKDDQGRALFDQYEIKGVVGSRYEPLREIEIRAEEPNSDVLLLQFKGNRTDYKTVDMCIGVTVAEGQDLVAIGFPKDSERTIISGKLSNKAGSRGRWQTEAPFIEGYSGGPVFAMDGRVVGIVAGGTPGVEGRNFLTPLNYASYLLGQLPETVKPCVTSKGIGTEADLSVTQGPKPLAGYSVINVSGGSMETYPVGVRIDLTLRHNLLGPGTILVKGLRVAVVAFNPQTICQYNKNADAVFGLGQRPPMLFYVRLNGPHIQQITRKDKDAIIHSIGDDLFDTEPPPPLTLDLQPNENDVEPLHIIIHADRSGSYEVALQLVYDTPKGNRTLETDHVRLCK